MNGVGLVLGGLAVGVVATWGRSRGSASRVLDRGHPLALGGADVQPIPSTEDLTADQGYAPTVRQKGTIDVSGGDPENRGGMIRTIQREWGGEVFSPKPTTLRKYVNQGWALPHGIRLGTTLGCGKFACVYAVEDPTWAIKVTCDWTEAAAWAHVGRRAVAGAARTPIVRGLRTIGGDVMHYWIVQERLSPLDELARDWVKKWAEPDLTILSGATWGADYPASIRKLRATASQHGLPFRRIEGLLSGLERLRHMGISTSDLHADNLMQRANGDIVVTDLGLSSGPTVRIPVIREIG